MTNLVVKYFNKKYIPEKSRQDFNKILMIGTGVIFNYFHLITLNLYQTTPKVLLKWNPHARQYILAQRGKAYILDLIKSFTTYIRNINTSIDVITGEKIGI